MYTYIDTYVRYSTQYAIYEIGIFCNCTPFACRQSAALGTCHSVPRPAHASACNARQPTSSAPAHTLLLCTPALQAHRPSTTLQILEKGPCVHMAGRNHSESRTRRVQKIISRGVLWGDGAATPTQKPSRYQPFAVKRELIQVVFRSVLGLVGHSSKQSPPCRC